MIFTFRLVSDEVDNFKREIKIDSDSTFAELKDAICESVDYDGKVMSSFFICEDDWEKIKEITMEDMGSDSSQDVYLMDETVIGDMVEDEGQRLMFTFDYLTDRSFFMELKEIEPGKRLSQPECVAKRGEAPAQTIDFDQFEATVAPKVAGASTDIDEDFYGSDSYSDDEFDAAGFDEMTFDQ